MAKLRASNFNHNSIYNHTIKTNIQLNLFLSNFYLDHRAKFTCSSSRSHNLLRMGGNDSSNLFCLGVISIHNKGIDAKDNHGNNNNKSYKRRGRSTLTPFDVVLTAFQVTHHQWRTFLHMYTLDQHTARAARNIVKVSYIKIIIMESTTTQASWQSQSTP